MPLNLGKTMSVHLLLILGVLFQLSCGRKEKETVATDPQREQLEAGLLDREVSGDWHDCDSALWAGLAARSNSSIQLSLFLDKDGRPMRMLGYDCLSEDSASTTSNDMMTGLILGYLHQKDLNSLKALYLYGYNHQWIMGTPVNMVSRVYLRPNGQSLLSRSIQYLGGGIYPQANYPIVYTPLQDADYQTHLQLVSILIGRDLGNLGNNPLGELVVQETCKYNRQDALAMVICGDRDLAAELLLGDYQYPSYVRGSEEYKKVHWRLVATLILESK